MTQFLLSTMFNVWILSAGVAIIIALVELFIAIRSSK